jgi:2-polyprenyl-3-methyl-5-hydroxy-6-metoxy-1,4-benzoquinol methylase
MLPCRDDGLLRNHAPLPERLFEPLGYEVCAGETALLDERFPEWGDSPYLNLSIRGKVRLRDLLNHIYVLIPVFDRQKHYWVGEAEIGKLLSHGKGWLEDHPEKTLITRRYFKNLRSLARTTLDRLDNGEGGAEELLLAEPDPDQDDVIPVMNDTGGQAGLFQTEDQHNKEGEVAATFVADPLLRSQAPSATPSPRGSTPKTPLGDVPPDLPSALSPQPCLPMASFGHPVPESPGVSGGCPARKEPEARPKLNIRRLEAVLEAIKKSGAESVIDLGCGEGNLLRLLIKENAFTRIAGIDVSRTALERARIVLNIDRMPEARQKRLSLFQSSLTYRDKRLHGYDAAALVEVMEHLDENRLDIMAAVVFGDAHPGTVVMTTPNIEYNDLYGLPRFRHADHRFEWPRARFQSWAEEIARRYGYTVSFEGIGEADEKRGAPTQMGIFTGRESPRKIT